MNRKSLWPWFLFGLGAHLQIVASLSFTELFVFVSAPIVFFKEYAYLKKNGVLFFLYLSFAVVVGCAVASVCNHTESRFVLRGMAVTSLLPCTVVVGHRLLRRDMGGFKWMLVGGAISSILSTFVFQKSVEVTALAGGESGAGAVEAIMSGPIYWITRLGSIITVLPKGWYLQTPLGISVVLPIFMAGFAIITSASGRSAALSAAAAAVIVMIGGKRPSRIKRNICDRFWLLVVLGVIGVFVVKGLYSYSSEKGWLGEDARNKFELQTRGDTSMKRILLGGRMESFCGLIACADKPIVGFGPWAVDENGYVSEFLKKYATLDDYMEHLSLVEFYEKKLGSYRSMIPCHAYITEFWCWYGIFGLLFWLYVMFVLLRYLRQDCWAVPQWFMWLAAAIPSYFWGIFFSPWSARVGGIVFVVACLMARAVRLGKQELPTYMIDEIRRADGAVR